MKIGKNGINLIKFYEGLRLSAYQCSSGVWTIGYGHTKTAKPGMRINHFQADKLFEEDIASFERDVTKLLKVPVSQNQFDALVSFAFNVGSDIDADDVAEGLGDSTLLKRVNMMDFLGASQEFLKWTRSNGKVLSGLEKRRKSESRLFLTKDGESYVIQVD